LRQGRVQEGLDALDHIGREAQLAHRTQPQLATVQLQHRDACPAARVACESDGAGTTSERAQKMDLMVAPGGTGPASNFAFATV